VVVTPGRGKTAALTALLVRRPGARLTRAVAAFRQTVATPDSPFPSRRRTVAARVMHAGEHACGAAWVAGNALSAAQVVEVVRGLSR
jgi:hypothetical protein